jgi:hypothetical protein
LPLAQVPKKGWSQANNIPAIMIAVRAARSIVEGVVAAATAPPKTHARLLCVRP